MSNSSQDVEFVNGMDYLVGYDSINRSIHAPAVQGTLPVAINTPSQEMTWQIQFVNSQVELAKSMSIDASASISYLALGGGNAKYQMFELQKVSSYTLDVLVYVSVRNVQRIVPLKDITWISAAAQQLFDSNRISFTDTFGDSFIYGLMTGGELFGVLSLQSESSAVIKNATASLQASGGFGSFSGSAGIAAINTLSQEISKFSWEVRGNRIGGVGKPMQKAEELLDAAVAFPGDVVGAGAANFHALTIPYTSVFISQTSPMDRQNQIDSIRNLGETRIDLMSNLINYDYALKFPERFDSLDQQHVQNKESETQAAITTVVTAARRCFAGAANCGGVAADIQALRRLDLPARKANVPVEHKIKIVAKNKGETSLTLDPGATWTLFEGKFDCVGNRTETAQMQTTLTPSNLELRCDNGTITDGFECNVGITTLNDHVNLKVQALDAGTLDIRSDIGDEITFRGPVDNNQSKRLTLLRSR